MKLVNMELEATGQTASQPSSHLVRHGALFLSREADARSPDRLYTRFVE
jgi:hypothetical protein